jgi:hypothetical protein
MNMQVKFRHWPKKNDIFSGVYMNRFSKNHPPPFFKDDITL